MAALAGMVLVTALGSAQDRPPEFPPPPFLRPPATAPVKPAATKKTVRKTVELAQQVDRVDVALDEVIEALRAGGD